MVEVQTHPWAFPSASFWRPKFPDKPWQLLSPFTTSLTQRFSQATPPQLSWACHFVTWKHSGMDWEWWRLPPAQILSYRDRMECGLLHIIPCSLVLSGTDSWLTQLVSIYFVTTSHGGWHRFNCTHKATGVQRGWGLSTPHSWQVAKPNFAASGSLFKPLWIEVIPACSSANEKTKISLMFSYARLCLYVAIFTKGAK